MARPWVLFALLPLLGACYPDAEPAAYVPKQEALRLLERAALELASGKVEEATSLAGAACNTDPDYDEAAWVYATLLGRTGRVEEALEICSKLGARSPAYVQAHLLEGILWDQLGNREAANLAYDRTLTGIAKRASSADLVPELRLYEAVAVYLRDGKLAGVQAINHVLAEFPDYPPAHYVKACMLDKNRGFLMRWFSDGGAHSETGPPQEDVKSE